MAKITPTKTGQFVTLWKRVGDSPIMPYDLSDPIDLFVVGVKKGEHFGHFVFPTAILYEKGIVSKDGKGGKRAIRVYPPWDVALNRQAEMTKKWQNAFFLEIPIDKPIDPDRIRQLYIHRT